MDDWLIIAEAAERLSITPNTLRSWIRTGRIPASKQGSDRPGPGRREWRVRASDVAALLGGEATPAPDTVGDSVARTRKQIGERLLAMLDAGKEDSATLAQVRGYALGLIDNG